MAGLNWSVIQKNITTVDGGKDDDYAERIYDKANQNDDVLYVKSDSSLDDGMELVSHLCSMQYHKHEFPWKEIMKEAVQLGYRSHNTTKPVPSTLPQPPVISLDC